MRRRKSRIRPALTLFLFACSGIAAGQERLAERAAPGSEQLARAVLNLASWVAKQRGHLSARVVDCGSGRVVVDANPDLPVNPASNMKVLTAAAALTLLGPEYRFRTGLYGVMTSGRVARLVLRGQGDPSLATDDLWRLARELKAMGVGAVDQIGIDQSRFDEQFVPPAFEQQPAEWAAFRAPVSAVALERNALEVNVMPTEPGKPARVWVDPPGAAELSGTVLTRAAGGGQKLDVSLSPGPDRLQVMVSGHLSETIPRLRLSKRLDDPRLAPGQVLREILRDLDVKVGESVGLASSAGLPELAMHESEPLSQLLYRLGKNSDNYYAEMLLLALGAESGQVPASSASGAAVVTRWLGDLQALSPQTRITNGSGLFDANRVSAATLTKVLISQWQSPATFPEFLAQLSVGGVDGTLSSRFETLPRGTIRAKTGTLAQAVALSGYVLRPSPLTPLAFSFLVDGIGGQAGTIRARLDAIVAEVVKGGG